MQSAPVVKPFYFGPTIFGRLDPAHRSMVGPQLALFCIYEPLHMLYPIPSMLACHRVGVVFGVIRVVAAAP